MPDASRLRALLTSRPRILVTADLTEDAVAALRSLGEVRPLGWAAGRWFALDAELAAAAREADVLVIGYEPVRAELLDAAPSIRLIASIRSDPRANVDVDAATARGIPVLHTQGRTDHAVAEFTVGLMLALARNLVPAAAWMRRRPADFALSDPFYRETVWGTSDRTPQLLYRGVELAGRTLGIVGLGSIGRAVARKVSGFGVRLIGHDPYIRPDLVNDLGVELTTLEQLVERADIVTLHARVTPSSRGLINTSTFARMKRGAYLINTARAGLVDRPALVTALESGRLAGVALDVFEEEPPSSDDPLLTHERVLATPHLAAWTHELTDHHSGSLVEGILTIASGKHSDRIVNVDVFAEP